MNQTIGAYLDCILLIFFGVFGLFFTRLAMPKTGKGEENEKRAKVLKIGGAVLLLIGLVKLASKLLGWGL